MPARGHHDPNRRLRHQTLRPRTSPARDGQDGSIEWRFLEFRLTRDTAPTAKGAQAVCVFVNDQLDRPCLEALAAQGVKLVALRCTGFNNVDLAAAKELKLAVTRVPVYSPYAVAEHAVALLLTLNRKVHRAFNRVRELNFSLNGLVGFDLHGKTAGIVGTGKIGRIVAQILRGFGMKVLAYDPFPNRDWAAEQGVEYVDARLARRAQRCRLPPHSVDAGDEAHHPARDARPDEAWRHSHQRQPGRAD